MRSIRRVVGGICVILAGIGVGVVTHMGVSVEAWRMFLEIAGVVGGVVGVLLGLVMVVVGWAEG